MQVDKDERLSSKSKTKAIFCCFNFDIGNIGLEDICHYRAKVLVIRNPHGRFVVYVTRSPTHQAGYAGAVGPIRASDKEETYYGH